ncbi:phospholipase D-like domain-containing protein [Hymenobacter sublimis]|uniref:phospholipase D n=1 Tax=Hymenobacter sublimis TaxID=2933777 RepID=A0ABY4J894_9BACT|nr:phospholipase D-like domain-containing protein [Hymenobacter sublimis]UPL48840.1 phospholipase D-like domain-containing protein [Hymenobacter sublimis]
MSGSPTSASADLLQQFQQAFADVNLSSAEAHHLRDRLASFAGQGGDVGQLRHQVFALARERFNTFKDKAVVEWLEAATILLPEATLPVPQLQSSAAEVYFSPGQECVAAIRRFILEARSTLDVCVFTVADDRLTDALLTAHRAGVRLRLLTDNDKLFDRGSDVRQLHAAGVPVRTDCTEYHMHHKFALADRQRVLTGSYNWTRSAAEHNLENLLITSDPAIVARYAAEFERLWAQLSAYQG